MKIIRTILGNLILFFDWLFSPRPIERSADEQAKIDEKTKYLALYQFKMCPFCVKIRRVIKRQNLKIELCDALTEQYEKELIDGGGKRQVPCLRIEKEDGSVEWLYESDAVKEYLEAL